MSKTTSQKIDAAENVLINQIDKSQAGARGGKAPQAPDLEGHRQEMANQANSNSRFTDKMNRK